MRTLIFIRGLPSSGKTTLANDLCKHFKFKLIDPDLVNEAQILSLLTTNNQRIRPKVAIYKYNIEKCIDYLLNDEVVIWTQPWRNLDNLKKSIAYINVRVDKIQFIIIEICVDLRTIWIRNKKKFKYKSRLFSRYVSKYDSNNHFQGNYHKIDGNQERTDILNEALKVIEKYF